MLSASKILFAAVLSSAVCITQAKVYRFIRGSPLFHNNRLVLRNFHKEIRCTLNFKAINSGVTKEMKSMIGTRRGSVMSLAVLSLEVDGKCMNLTVCDPTGNIDEYMIVTCMNLTVCEPSGNIDEDMPGYMIVRSRNNLLFRGNLAKAILMIKSKGLVYGGKSLPRIMCFLPSSQVTYTSHRTNTEALTDNVRDVNGMETNQQHEQQRNTLPSDCHECPCPPSVHLTRSSLNAAIASAIASAIAFCIPALLCLFSPTGITQDGIQQINLEGASPVSLRSMIGNYFFSQDYSARAFTEIIVVFSVLFFLNFFRLFADSNLWPGLYLLLNSFRLFHLLCYVCCVFQLYMSFLGVKSSDEKTCSLCSSDQHELKCRDLSFPKRITHHLCQQPSIWLTCWRKLFLLYLVKYFRVSLSFVRSCKISLSSVLCISLLLLLFPVVTILLLTMLFLVVLGMAIVTSPLSTIGEALDIQNDSLGSYSTSLSRTVSILSRTALFFAMYSIVFPLREIVRLAITLLLSDKTLPYLSCFILICYYLSRSYSAFTSPYQELGLMLYKQYKNPPAGTGQEAANTPIPVHVVVIPKELFDKACEQIMPIGVSVCILLLRVSLFLSFVFFVFFSMENYVTTEPPIRAVVTLLGGLLPKVTDIFNCSGHKNIEATATEEKVRYIVNNYKKNKARHRTVSTQFDSADQIAFNLHGKTEACSETILQHKFKQL